MIRSTAGGTVRVEGLTKRFPVVRGWGEALRQPFRRDYQVALQDVTFEVGAGEFFGLLGPNGAGKTTLFKVLSTSIIPDSGIAVVAGSDVVQDAAGVRRALTPVLANERSLNWRLSGRENLRMFAALYGIHGSEAATRIDAVLRLVRLEHEGTKSVSRYSSGMKQRLLIARALITRPRVLLLDEPTRSLDPVSAAEFRDFLKEDVVRREGCTVLLATHSPEDVVELCDRVGVIQKGRLIEVGVPERLMQRYGDHRLRLCVRHPATDRDELSALIGHPVLDVEPADDAGWTWVTVDGGETRDDAARLLAGVLDRGLTVSSFEAVELTLAELIGRIVERHA